jgi:hypothetical protein
MTNLDLVQRLRTAIESFDRTKPESIELRELLIEAVKVLERRSSRTRAAAPPLDYSITDEVRLRPTRLGLVLEKLVGDDDGEKVWVRLRRPVSLMLKP